MRAEAAKELLSVPVRGFIEDVLRHPQVGGELGDLLRGGRYQEAASLAEHALATPDGSPNGSAPESDSPAKFGWILAHLHLSSVPPAALSSAFSEEIGRLAAGDVMSSTAIVTSLLLIEKLTERGQLRLAASVAENTEPVLDRADALDGELRNQINRYLIALLKQELTRAESKRESAPYLARLRSRITTREAIKFRSTPNRDNKQTHADSSAQPAAVAVAEKRPRAKSLGGKGLSAKTLFEEAAEERSSEKPARESKGEVRKAPPSRAREEAYTDAFSDIHNERSGERNRNATSREEEPRSSSLDLDERQIRTASEVGSSMWHNVVAGDMEATPPQSDPKPRWDFGTREPGRRALALIVATCLIIVGTGTWQLVFRRPTSTESGLQVVLHLSTSDLLDPEYPSVVIPNGEQLARRLADLNMNITQVGARVKNIGSGLSSDASADGSATPPDAAGTRKGESGTPGTPTSGSPDIDRAALEGPEAKALRAKAGGKSPELVPLGGEPRRAPVREAPVDPRRTPRLEPADLNGIEVKDLDRGQSQDTLSAQELRVGPDGRIYGPARTIDPAIGTDGRPAGRDLDGSPLQSYEVKQFDRPMTFKTIVATSVLAAPSHMAGALSHLEAETPIHVVAQMGMWLELRSAQGRRGYIFAQDATPSEP